MQNQPGMNQKEVHIGQSPNTLPKRFFHLLSEAYSLASIFCHPKTISNAPPSWIIIKNIFSMQCPAKPISMVYKRNANIRYMGFVCNLKQAEIYSRLKKKLWK